MFCCCVVMFLLLCGMWAMAWCINGGHILVVVYIEPASLWYLCEYNDYCFEMSFSSVTSALNCLTFDFIGTSVDESSDDLGTVQIPTSWRPAFLDFSTVQLFFDLYASLPATLSPVVRAMLCIMSWATKGSSMGFWGYIGGLGSSIIACTWVQLH